MTTRQIQELICIDEDAITPKYQQIVSGILQSIRHERLQQGDMLPSINECSYVINAARDTVDKAYRELKKSGVVASHPGKGFFIRRTDITQPYQICLFFNRLSAHKKIIYDHFMEAMGDEASAVLFVYNDSLRTFRRMLAGQTNEFTHYVVIPHFTDAPDDAACILNAIPKHKLVILDKLPPGLHGNFAAVYQDFENDIYEALQSALHALSKYHTINLIFPANAYYPVCITKGFSNFCQDYAFTYNITPHIHAPIPGHAFITLTEEHLVTLVERLVVSGFRAGHDIGIISYNDTPLKNIILNGITTISADFVTMSRTAAELIKTDSTKHFTVPSRLSGRTSI